jgi:hypothetical protein
MQGKPFVIVGGMCLTAFISAPNAARAESFASATALAHGGDSYSFVEVGRKHHRSKRDCFEPSRRHGHRQAYRAPRCHAPRYHAPRHARHCGSSRGFGFGFHYGR